MRAMKYTDGWVIEKKNWNDYWVLVSEKRYDTKEEAETWIIQNTY